MPRKPTSHIDFQQMSASVLEKIDYVDPAN